MHMIERVARAIDPKLWRAVETGRNFVQSAGRQWEGSWEQKTIEKKLVLSRKRAEDAIDAVDGEIDFGVEWQMDWGEKRNLERHPERYEMMFEENRALSELLHEQVVFLNSYWWEKELPEHIQGSITVSVQCSDVFAWACADAESLPYDQIERLWRMWKKDEHWGAAVWCMLRRKQMPQKPVEEKIRSAGIWDLDSLNLDDNTQDEWVHAQFRRYAALQESKETEG